MTSIHPLAIVSDRAEIGKDVSIGPFCVIEDGTRLGDGCELSARVVIKEGAVLGRMNRLFEGCVIGGRPQHLGAGEELGRVIVGDENIIRENATIHRGLAHDKPTCVGSKNLLMVNSHVAHDCQLGSNIIIANNVMLAGHVLVGDRAYIAGGAAVHQFCRIGGLAMVGGQAHVAQDVPPFVTVDGLSSLIVGLNVIGLRRAGLTSDDIQALKAAYRVIYRSGMKWTETLEVLKREFTSGPASEYHAFLEKTERGVVQERRTPRKATVKFPKRGGQPDEEPKRKAG